MRSRPLHPELPNSCPKGRKTSVSVTLQFLLSPELEHQHRESCGTYDLVLTAGETDNGRPFPNLVWTQVAIHVLQNTDAVFPLRTIPHPAQVHRLGATQQTYGRFLRARLCNTVRHTQVTLGHGPV